jgi:hypothetical protein
MKQKYDQSVLGNTYDYFFGFEWIVDIDYRVLGL